MSRAYGYMDSHPRQSHIMPSRQHGQPMPDEIPPQLGINPTLFPVPHEPLPYPYGGNCSYPAPCHACYNHMATPSYYHRPPYPYFFQPPPFNCWGPYPGNAEPFASHNELPYPSAYPMERPYVVREHHCCGCPNHVCDPKNEKGVKIEEHEPLDSNKKVENYPESLVPANWRNFPYPIVWIPPENNRNKEQGIHVKPRIMDLDTASQEKKPAVSSLHKEPAWNSWFPLFMGNYDHSKPGGETKRSDNQHTRNNERNYPFPVIWIPPYDKQEEAEAKKEQQNNTLESPESNFKVFPILLHNNHDKTSDGGVEVNYRNEVGSHHQDAEKNIDVKDIEPYVGKNNSRDSQEAAANALSKRTIDSPVDRVPGFDARKSLSSSTKTSKLPPVCLRVDPLPRKNGRNGSSKSPSPPGSEMKSRSSSDAPSTDSNKHNSRTQSMNRTSEEHPKRKEVKVIEVKGATSCPSNNNSGDSQSGLQVEHPEKIKENKDHSEKEEVCEIKEDKGIPIAGDESIEKRSEELQASRTLSDEEAAMRIQSTYRGFQVRKWETLKKLKQMAKVRDEVTKVRKSIDELASSEDTLPVQGKLERQKVLIGESIMNLLLRLDTIQGLHPNLRDIRKSLARELVALQEELDSLTTKSLEESVDNSDTARDDESMVSEKEHDEEAKRQFEDSLSVSENIGGQCESEEEQLLKAENSVSEQSENACSGIVDDKTQVVFEDLKSETSASLDVKLQQAALQHCTNEIDDGEPPMVSVMEPTETDPNRPAGEKDERVELATMNKSNYDSGVEDEMRLASDLGDGSSTKMEFMSTDQVTSALQALPQADEEKETIAVDGVGVEPATFPGPTLCTGDEDLISHRVEPEVEVASKIHIAEEDVAASVLSKHENCGNLTIEVQQLEVPKAITSDSEEVDNVHLEQLVAPVPDDLSPVGSLKSEESSQDAPNGAERDQRHEEGNSDEAPLPPRPEAQLGMLESKVETCQDVNEDKAIVSADLSCNCSDMLNGEALAWEKEGLIAENVENTDLTTRVGEQVHEREDNHEEEVVVIASEKSVSDEGAEQVEQSPPSHEDSNASRPVEKTDGNEKLIKENEKLREMMEKLMEAGKEQLNVISELTVRVKDLETRLARNKRTKPRCRAVAAKPRSAHAKSCADSMN
ncbi:BAG family molecular chaperone regulator 6 isoform X2 [Rhodamnia argentea]|uniref:BAG family molecular chaperone regulator 6 isoform X2 n=1 Tax=Rhodamnia argentea TaxID=178133 RepID=A0ABM3HX71_9MYRT|nr:BAG family molecular chaperone regulator 6 isoform X2 [Rhodamnia argentea]